MFDNVKNKCYIIDNKGENMSKITEKYAYILSENLFFDKILESLGGDKSYMGYYQIVEILSMLINEKIAGRSFSREVYPRVAKKLGVSEASIERDIRNFIDKNWNEKMKAGLYPFWASDEKPTCCKFLFMVKSYTLSKIA